MFDSKKVVVAVKYGASASSADVVAISNEEARLSPTIAKGDFKCLAGKLGNKTTWMNDDDVTVEGATLESYLVGNDATGAELTKAPEWHEVYKLCCLKEVVDSEAETVTYTPMQEHPSDKSEVIVWRDGLKRSVQGAIATLNIDGQIGEPIKQTADISGFTTVESQKEANPAGSCVDNSLLLVLKSTDTITFNGTAYKGQSFKLTQGNELTKILALSGQKGYERADFDSTLEVTYFKENENIYTDFKNGTSHKIEIKAGSADGKAVKIVAPNAHVQELSESSIEGKEAVTVTFSLQGIHEESKSGANDRGEKQFSIIYGKVVS